MWRSMLKDGGWIGFIMLIAGGVFFWTLGVLSHAPEMTVFFIAMGCILVASAVIALYRRNRRYGDGPTTDEREQWIRARGDSAAGLALLIVWGSACLVPYFIATANGEQSISIPANWLPTALVCGVFIQAIVRMTAMWLIRRREIIHAQK